MKRRRFTEEQIIRILQEAERGELSIQDICRKNGVSEQSFYRWRNKYGGMDVSDARKLRELEGENSRFTSSRRLNRILFHYHYELLDLVGLGFSIAGFFMIDHLIKIPQLYP